MKTHGGNLNAYYYVEEANVKRLCTHHMIPNLCWCSGKGEMVETKHISGCRWGDGGGRSRWATENFRAVELPYVIQHEGDPWIQRKLWTLGDEHMST